MSKSHCFKDSKYKKRRHRGTDFPPEFTVLHEEGGVGPSQRCAGSLQRCAQEKPSSCSYLFFGKICISFELLTSTVMFQNLMFKSKLIQNYEVLPVTSKSMTMKKKHWLLLFLETLNQVDFYYRRQDFTSSKAVSKFTAVYVVFKKASK